MNNCPHCLRVLPDEKEITLNSIYGNFHAKRAAEIALVGNHTIAFYGPTAAQMAQWVTNNGGNAYEFQLCPCGNYMDYLLECKCEIEDIYKWQETSNYKKCIGADIVIKTVRPSVGEVESFENGKGGETDNIVLGRIEECKKLEIVPNELDELAVPLIRAFANKLPEYVQYIPQARQVGRTIAKMAKLYIYNSHIKNIEVAHLAEALQYRFTGY